MHVFFILMSIFWGFSLHARPEEEPPEEFPTPWFTGPLIAPPGTVTDKGVLNLNMYVYAIAQTGEYNSQWKVLSTPNFYTISPELFLLYGITHWLDFQTTPNLQYNITKNQSSIHFGDLPLGFNFQLIRTDLSPWFPGVKLSIIESFPTGKYQKLNPKKLETDASGDGTFSTNLALVFFQEYEISKRHFLTSTLSIEYDIASSVFVKGFNVYGGGHGTRGKVYPGNTLTTIYSVEYTFNRNWVFALDNVYVHTNRTKFSGRQGFESPDVLASVGEPSSEQISFAPAIEYNFSDDFGIIVGAWVSAFGRNTDRFRSGVINIEYSF